VLQTLKGLEDPRKKADNPNPIPVPDIFTRLQVKLQGTWRPEPAILSSADKLYVREALESNF